MWEFGTDYLLHSSSSVRSLVGRAPCFSAGVN